MNHPVNDPSSVENLDVNLFSPSIYAPTTTTTVPAVSETDIKNKDCHNRNAQKPRSSPLSAKIIAFGDASGDSRIVKIEAEAGSLGEMSFEDPIISPNSIQKLYTALEFGEPAVKRSITRTTIQAQQDHVLAERKRREKLSELFVSLSTMIPGLKKVIKGRTNQLLIDYNELIFFYKLCVNLFHFTIK